MKLIIKEEGERLWRARRKDGTEVGSIMVLKDPRDRFDFLVLGNKKEKTDHGVAFSFDGIPKEEINQIVDFADQLYAMELGL